MGRREKEGKREKVPRSTFERVVLSQPKSLTPICKSYSFPPSFSSCTATDDRSYVNVDLAQSAMSKYQKRRVDRFSGDGAAVFPPAIGQLSRTFSPFPSLPLSLPPPPPPPLPCACCRLLCSSHLATTFFPFFSSSPLRRTTAFALFPNANAFPRFITSEICSFGVGQLLTLTFSQAFS